MPHNRDLHRPARRGPDDAGPISHDITLRWRTCSLSLGVETTRLAWRTCSVEVHVRDVKPVELALLPLDERGLERLHDARYSEQLRRTGDGRSGTGNAFPLE